MKLASFRIVLFIVISLSVILDTNHAFAMTEDFSVLPTQQKTFAIVLHPNQKIFFQIFVSGGDDSIRLKIIDNNTNFEYYNSIIRAEKQNIGYDTIIHPAYKSEISNNDHDIQNLIFTFDNSLSTTGEKKIVFTYSILTQSGETFEDTQLWSWISTFLTIVIIITIIIVVIVMILKKMKRRPSS